MMWPFPKKKRSEDSATCEVRQAIHRQKQTLQDLDQVNERVIKALLKTKVDKGAADG
jgi:flavin-binding protein dodecin